jgi:O-antigen ligase
MLIVIYWLLCKYEDPARFGNGKKTLLVGLALAAMYCLYYSGVRTAILGLAVFFGVLLYFWNKRLLFIGAAALVGVAAVFSQTLQQHLLYEKVMLQKAGGDAEELASGRPRIWADNLSEFIDMPIDRQLAGVGIGNSADRPGSDLQKIVDSHNDYLEVFLQTGFVGFFLFFALHVALMRAIFRLDGVERFLFLALFAAVVLMNLMSNSYVSRFGLAQMYYVILAFVELRQPKPNTHAVASPRPLSLA